MHGIPDDKTVLKDGDIISIDAGAIVDGWHGDAAFTAFVGSGHAPELVELSRVTEESMWAGIAAMKPGNRLVDVSRAIETYIRRQPKPGGGRYGIIEDYGGHGIGTEMHMDPHLLNYVERRPRQGPEARPRSLSGRRADGVPGHAEDRGAGGRLDRHHDGRYVVLALGALGGGDGGGPAGPDGSGLRQGEAGGVRSDGGAGSAGVGLPAGSRSITRGPG